MTDPYSEDELKKLDIKKLNEIKGILEKVVNEIKSENKSKAINKVQDLLNEMGLSLTDVGLSKTQTKTVTIKKPVEPKYYNPANTSETWAGRGKQPKWFKDALATGKTREDMMIHPQAPEAV